MQIVQCVYASILCIFVSFRVVSSNFNYEDMKKAGEAPKDWCVRMKLKYSIDPGQSFGTLPLNLHNLYLAGKCYRFFCKPNKMAGMGKFVCEPLEVTESLVNKSSSRGTNMEES